MKSLARQTRWDRQKGSVGSRGSRARGARARRQQAEVMLEVLEDRRLLSTLDITGGALTYTAAPTSASDLTVSIDPSDTANVIFTDADQLITLAGAGTSGWTGNGTNTVT